MFERGKIIFEGDTEFEHYQVVDLNYGGRKARVLFSGNRDAAFSGVALDDNPELLFDYIQRFFELVAHIKPKKLLIIGGGTYTLPLALLKEMPGVHIDVVEIDPGLDEIAEKFFGLVPDKRFKIIHGDGKEYLKNNKELYDLIIVDAFQHLRIPASLASEDTPELIQKHLTVNGTAAVNIIGTYYGRMSGLLADYYEMYESAFSHVSIHPADRSLSLWLSQNFILIGQKGIERSSYGMQSKSLKGPASA